MHATKAAANSAANVARLPGENIATL
jgi:hypothetical protein